MYIYTNTDIALTLPLTCRASDELYNQNEAVAAYLYILDMASIAPSVAPYNLDSSIHDNMAGYFKQSKVWYSRV